MAKKSAYFYANGKRKNAVATIHLHPEGSGEFTINGKSIQEWGDDRQAILTVQAPLEVLGLKKDMDVEVITRGGGKRAQSEAIRLGLSRALVKKDPTAREQLKQEGFMTRDSRVKERKKPGLRGARRSPQWSKR